MIVKAVYLAGALGDLIKICGNCVNNSKIETPFINSCSRLMYIANTERIVPLLANHKCQIALSWLVKEILSVVLTNSVTIFV